MTDHRVCVTALQQELFIDGRSFVLPHYANSTSGDAYPLYKGNRPMVL